MLNGEEVQNNRHDQLDKKITRPNSSFNNLH